MPSPILFFTKIGSPDEMAGARLLIQSLRSFGGALSACLVWVFTHNAPYADLADANVRVFPFTVTESLRGYPFASLITVCKRAEELAPAGTPALVWLDPNCLIVQPPLLFDLGASFDAALRPVHVRNVGSPPTEPPDAFWGGIYAALGVADVSLTVTSFIDRQELRAYFNSHAMAIRPALGLFGRWHELFEGLVADRSFQAAACGDELHRIFLFQALFSALVATALPPQRIRILPESYNYPYHLHDRTTAEQRAAALNDLVLVCNEDRLPHPDRVTDIEIREPLRSWLAQRIPA